MRYKSFFLVPVLFLAGCDSGPSADDIKVAMQTASDSFMPKMIVVESVTNVTCKDAQGKPGYVCSFTLAGVNNITKQRTSNPGEGRFIKTGSTWSFSPQ